jgi:hypothetical protein
VPHLTRPADEPRRSYRLDESAAAIEWGSLPRSCIAPPPFLLDGREHFTAPPVPGRLTASPAEA